MKIIVCQNALFPHSFTALKFSFVFNRLETKESWKGQGILAATQVERMKRKGHSFESISGRRIGKTSAPSEDIDRLRTGQCSQSTQGKKHIE